MDPDQTLKELRILTEKVLREYGYAPFSAQELAEHFQALDQWLMHGGFLPQEWDRRHKDLL